MTDSALASHQYNGQLITQLSEDATIANMTIPKGYVNATEMCKANGKRFDKYMTFSKTPEFLEELSKISVDPSQGVSNIIYTTEGQRITGTWVSFPVAINIAQWISPAFAAWASVTLALVIQGDYRALTVEAEEAQKKVQKLWEEVRLAGKVTRRSLTDSIKDWYSRNPGATRCPMPGMIARVTDAVYTAIWGLKAVDIEKHLNCDRHVLRDNLDPASLKYLDRVEAAVMEYIDEDNIKPIDAVPMVRIRNKSLPLVAA